AAAFRCQYPELANDHFAVVSNGFDAAQFELLETRVAVAERFEVLHAGALYYGRSLAAFLEAAKRLMHEDPRFESAFRLTLLGTLDATARAELAGHALGKHVQVLGQRAHLEALRAMHAADALLLIANTTPGAEATVPGKLFEYLAVGRPILAMAPRSSSTQD